VTCFCLAGWAQVQRERGSAWRAGARNSARRAHAVGVLTAQPGRLLASRKARDAATHQAACPRNPSAAGPRRPTGRLQSGSPTTNCPPGTDEAIDWGLQRTGGAGRTPPPFQVRARARHGAQVGAHMPKPEPALRADDATSSCVHTTTSLPTLASALCSSSSPLRVGWSRERALVHCSTPLLGG